MNIPYTPQLAFWLLLKKKITKIPKKRLHNSNTNIPFYNPLGYMNLFIWVARISLIQSIWHLEIKLHSEMMVNLN